VNSVGLRRGGFSDDERRALKDAYKLLFRSTMPIQETLRELEHVDDEHVAHLVKFIRSSKRGFTRA
jgi:UDP-N-acetylglucosamine acyltransferase